MRVTENMRFNQTVNNLFRIQFEYNDLMEKMASQKRVNRPSDDPVAATKIIEIRQGLAADEQFKKNLDECDAWISASESKLSSAYDLLVKAREIAVGQGTVTATAATRQIAARNVDALIEEMASLANAKMGDRYLFSGTDDGGVPFSTVADDARIGTARGAGDNAFAGTVTASGAYTGTANRTYAVRITGAGPLAAATCQISADGGRTWNGVDLSLASGQIDLGDGVRLSFDDGAGAKPLAEDDVFVVDAIAGGCYRGNDEPLTLTIGRGMSVTYNVTGADAFTAAGGGGVDLFGVLGSLKAALENNDAQGITGQLDNLKKAQDQISLSQSLCGTKASHIEMARTILSDLDEKLSSLLSTAQDADLADFATRLSMKEVALQASYAVTAKIGDTNILSFLK